MIARLKAVAAAALVVAALTGLATGLAAIGIGGDAPRPSGLGPIAKVDPAPRAGAGPAKAGEGEEITFRGRVLGAGRQAGGGRDRVHDRPATRGDWGEPILRAKTAADGSFRFAMPAAEVRRRRPRISPGRR